MQGSNYTNSLGAEVSSNDDFFQDQKPAAVLKHAVFASYASAFFSMVGSRHRGPMWLIDGYAGPGTYAPDDSGGQIKGSPIVALELARKQRGFAPPRDIRCGFIEAKPSYFNALTKNVRPFVEEGLQVELLRGSVKDCLEEIWPKVDGNPVLTFIDPFGVSAVSKEQMTNTLLARRRNSSEVLVNINVLAISRHGGCLRWGVDGKPELKPTVEHNNGVELSDTFFGGHWWREHFLNARARTGDANRAAMEVVDAYRARIWAETGASSLVVPIRRTPTGPMLFHYTLFHRHPAAAYKFADAAAKGTAEWRRAFRQQDLGDVLAQAEAQGSLFADDEIAAFTHRDAEVREAKLKEEAICQVESNIRRLLDARQAGARITVADSIEEILGGSMSLAGQPHIIAAWDRLAAAGLVRPRDKSRTRDLWKLEIVRR